MVIEKNYAAGADFIGFLTPISACTADGGVTFGAGNYAQAAETGWRYSAPGGACVHNQVQFTVSKCEGGIMTKSGVESVTIENVVAVDNVKGISIVSSGTDAANVTVKNCVILGRSLHSNCNVAQCGGLDCAARAGTILGSFIGGSEDITLTSKVKTPMDNPKEEQAWGGTFSWQDISYVNFLSSNHPCHFTDYVTKSNSGVTDKYAINDFKGLKLTNVEDNCIVQFTKLPDSLINVENCGWF